MSHRDRNGPQGRGYSAAGRLAHAERGTKTVTLDNFFADLKRRNIYKGCCRLRRLLAGLTENQISGNLAFYENNP
jgi:hypothetical protein